MNQKDYLDAASVVGAFGVFFDKLPDIVLVLTFIWLVIRIGEWFWFRVVNAKSNKNNKFP